MRACVLLNHSPRWLMVSYLKDDVTVSSSPTAISFTGRSLGKLRNARHCILALYPVGGGEDSKKLLSCLCCV